MQKYAERVDADAPGNGLLARAVDIPRPDDDVRDRELLPVIGNYVVLFDLCETVGFAAAMGGSFERTSLIQGIESRPCHVVIHCKRANVDEAPQALVNERGFEQIARRHDRIEKRIGKRFFASCQPPNGKQ